MTGCDGGGSRRGRATETLALSSFPSPLPMAQTRRLSGLNQPSSTTAATQLSTGLMLETYEICQSFLSRSTPC